MPTVYAYRDARVPAKCRVTLQANADDLAAIGGTAVNLSRSGMRIAFCDRATAPCQTGDKVTVIAMLPMFFGEFSATAQIIWARTKEGSSECGLRYLECAAADQKRLSDFLNAKPTQVLFVGCTDVAQVLSALASAQPIFPTFLAETAAAEAVVVREEISAIIVGGGLAANVALGFLEGVYARHPELNAPSVVFAAGADLTPFARLVGSGQLFFLTQKPPPASEMAAIVLGCIERYWVNVRREEVERSAAHNTDDALFEHVLQRSQVANRQTSAKNLCRVSEEAICELTGGERAYCLFHDQESETLWAPATDYREGREVSAAAGIVSYAARTGIDGSVTRVDQDARYERDADDPVGNGNEQMLVQPVLNTERNVVAVLVAIRDPGREPFTKEQQAALRIFASQLTATFGRLVTQIQIDRLQSGKSADQPVSPFSEEALQEYMRGHGEIGHLMQLRSPWIEYAFLMLLGFMAATIAFLGFSRVNQYGQGHAIVRLEHKIAIASKAQGVVTEVTVRVGDHVVPGTPLAVVDDSKERSEVLRLEHDLEQALILWLRDPSDALAGKQIAELRARREVALASLSTRTITASRAGVINDIRARPGQFMNLGDTVVSLSDATTPAYSLLAVFPGQYRPQTQLGSKLRLEFLGYPFAYQSVAIVSLGEAVVGPKEARRIVGAEHADSIVIDGPVFVAEASLPADGFIVDGIRYAYFDGLEASAQVKLRAEPILVMLVPGLRRLYDSWNRDD